MWPSTALLRKYFDKVPSKFQHFSREDFSRGGYRGRSAGHGFAGAPSLARMSVLMPSYVNIGAVCRRRHKVDTWATVGSCAQIGKNVHLSGGVGNRRRARAAASEPDYH
jgi:2,3,4,5-tetrahydropyridine-2-carboxylate N-succinyltransferase